MEYLAALRTRTLQAAREGGSVESGNSALNTALTEPAARVATAALIDASTAVANGSLDAAFVLAKPPTHHAVGNAARARGRYVHDVSIVPQTQKRLFKQDSHLVERTYWHVHDVSIVSQPQ